MSSGQEDIAQLKADVAAAIRDGQLITAINLWRDDTGLALAEAKAEMDALAARLGA